MIRARLSVITSGFLFLAILLLHCSKEEDPVEIQEPELPPSMSQDTTEEKVDGARFYVVEQYEVNGINIEVYLPSDYDAIRRYPTLYFNDGDLFSDVFGSLTTLEADPFIMVGLWDENTRRARFSAYEDDRLTNTYGTYVPSAEEYTRALVEEVIPFVEERYKSNKRALFGISLGGLHATWAGIKYPNAFSFTGALSPAYWVGERAIFEESFQALRPVGISRPRVFYFDRGTAEWRNFLPLVDLLKQVELIYGQNIYYYEVFGAAHDAPFWQLRIEVPFRLFVEGIGLAELTELDLNTYCADNLDAPGTRQGRINPLAKYSNGAVFSVMSEAEFKIVQGGGTVRTDGTYTITSGNSMTVECEYKGLTAQISVSNCN